MRMAWMFRYSCTKLELRALALWSSILERKVCSRALIVSIFCLVGLQSGIASAQLAAYPQSCQKLLRVADQCSDEAIAFERKGGGQKQIVEIEGLRQKIYGAFLLGLTNSGPDD